jgi:hypothetical protein
VKSFERCGYQELQNDADIARVARSALLSVSTKGEPPSQGGVISAWAVRRSETHASARFCLIEMELKFNQATKAAIVPRELASVTKMACWKNR